LNEFLFADVGVEASGMMLSVVSLIARQGADPWREAGRLADLPKDAAADSLAHDIADMPQGRWSISDAAVIARRLTGLLPTRPAKAEVQFSLREGNWKLSARNAIVMACLAFGMVYAFTAMTRPVPTDAVGGDAASVSPSLSGGASRTGAPNLPAAQPGTGVATNARPTHE
jgi:hypothetical protein